MRQILKRASKSTLSIILCLMMVFSTMLIGTVTNVTAAEINDVVNTDDSASSETPNVSATADSENVSASTQYVYLKNKVDDYTKWSSVKAYFHDGSNPVGGSTWPGVDMEAYEGYYRAEIPDGASYVIFNNGSGEQYPSSGGYALSTYAGQVFNVTNQTWYTVDTTAKYSITGTVTNAGGWEDSNVATISTPVNDGLGTYSIDVTVTDTDETTGNNFFRVEYNDTKQEYGPYNPDESTATNYLITQCSTSATAYRAHTTHGYKAFYFNETGNYTVYVRNSYNDNDDEQNRPDVWAVKNSDLNPIESTLTFETTYDNGTLSAKDASGNVINSGATVNSGDKITFTATPTTENYVCTAIVVNGTSYTPTASSGAYTYTVTIPYTSTTTTVSATFDEDSGEVVTGKYFLYGTSQAANQWTGSLPVYKNSNGEYYVTFTTTQGLTKGTKYYFAYSSSSSFTGMYKSNVSINKDPKDTDLVSVGTQEDYCGTSTAYKYGYFSVDSSSVYKVKITLTTDPTYTVIPYSNVPTDAITIWAKDGSTVSGGTNKYGETTITSGTLEGSTVTDEGTYKTYYAPAEGGIITIQTQLTEAYTTAGYYVYAYVINGKTVTTTKRGDGLYESTYSVPANYTGTIEITPVYFNTKIEEAGDYITFYADASEVSELWGNTVACYSYYYDGTSTTDGKPNALSESAYPGQPMLLNANGKYFTKLSRYYYDETGTKTSYQISGITLNNFYEYDIHGTLLTGDSAKNHQTYDYDDFKFLSDPALEYDTIQFNIEYRTSTSNQSILINDANNAPVPTTTFASDTFAWDDFTDYDGNLVDIQGNEVTDMDNKIYIVSTGNQNTSVGMWSTVWYVYDANGKYITKGNPSDFIPRSDTAQNTTAYNAMTAYAGYYTQICFESFMDASTSAQSTNSGNRVDGRWYYKNSTKSQVTVNVSVQYSDDNGVNWATDTTGTKGIATIDGVTEITYDQANIEATLNAVAGDGYMFYEWGMVDSNGENYKTLTKSVTDKFFVDTNYHLVARFVKVDDQSLVISHERYAGPDAVGGYGFYYASATLYHKDGTTEEFPQSESTFTVPLNYDLDSTLSITLTTTCSGANTFIAWYQYLDGNYEIIEPETDVYGKTGTVSYTFEMNVADLFKDQNTLVIQSLNYYSDIARVSVDAVLNYKYNNRFGEEKTYTKNVKLDDAYIAANGYTITDELIYANAPAIDDLYKDCKWTITEQTVSKNATTATLRATQEDKPYTVKFVETVDGKQVIKHIAVVALNDYIAVDGNGQIYGTKEDPADFKFYETAEKLGELSFAYWLVTDTETGKEVAKCYYHEFNLKIAGDYIIEAIYGDASTSITISDPTYTREQFTDSEGKVVTDYVYADFIVSYMEDNGNGVLLNSASGANYRTGLVVEFDKDVKVNVDDVAGGTLSDEQKVTFSSDSDTIKDFVLSGEGSKVYDTDDADTVANRALYNFAINNSDYNNKNRLDFYVRYNNTASIRQYAMKAYYYVYQVDADGNVVEDSYKITEPVYFYFYEIGNSTSNTAELVVTE